MVNLRAKEAERAAQMFKNQKILDEKQTDNFFDSEFTSSNKEVANILDKENAGTASQGTAAVAVNLEDAAWGDDDLDIEDDIVADADEPDAAGFAHESSDIFVPPSPGPDPILAMVRACPMNVAVNVAAGNFPKALELLKT